MIKPGWTHILTLRDGQKRVILIGSIEGGRGGAPYEVSGHYLVPPPHRRQQQASADGSYRFVVYRPEHWQPVCEGRHSNPEALLTQTDSEPGVRQGDVRKGRATGARYEVLGVHGDQVWTHQTGGTLPVQTSYTSWTLENFLSSTVEIPVFFEEGHDYERRTVAGGVIRVTVRAVGRMPMGPLYAVAERRNGIDVGSPALLTSYDFSTYEDVTR